jgi:hypothetical protein
LRRREHGDGHQEASRLSGPVSGGDYVGWDFFVRLDGASFQVASAWVDMEGIDASTCSMNL